MIIFGRIQTRRASDKQKKNYIHGIIAEIVVTLIACVAFCSVRFVKNTPLAQ